MSDDLEPQPRERRHYLAICLEVVTTDMRANLRVFMQYAALLLAALVFLAVWPGLATQARRENAPPPDRVAIWPGALALDYQTQCGGNQIASMSYWPRPYDTSYRADFMARGGADVYLSLPLGYESGMTMPDDGAWHHGAITVTVPGPVGEGPIRPIYLMADVYCSPATTVPPLARAYFRISKHTGPGTVVNPAHITDLNIYALSSYQP